MDNIELVDLVELGELGEGGGGENIIINHHRSCVRENSMEIAFVISCIIGFVIVGLGIKGYI